ncbi:serine/threonine protein kinase [Balneatrix alpica]|uniref:serine/threonine protein kinase n=1 Tax=Balneatrix alpica TaxID=75684 RepID=UPI0027390EAB|nr:serine/threonine protein kinase [Balneatrix alpica]
MVDAPSNQHPYARLDPDLMLDAIESTGLLSDARLLGLNSYENRVYQVGIEGHAPLIAKFYRPERWSDAAIQEEHTFTRQLRAAELSVVAPLTWAELVADYSAEAGDDYQAEQTLFEYQGFRFALFPRQGGHPPELDNPEHLYQLGQTLGRFHALGATTAFQARHQLSIDLYGHQARTTLLACPLLPNWLRGEYEQKSAELLGLVEQRWHSLQPLTLIRVHGDCHPGNMLWRDERPHFVDFDDAMMAPAVQDIWMLLSGDAQQQQLQLAEVLEGYEEFFEFDRRQLRLCEALRALRLLHYSAWLAKRWQDPAFPLHFPWFERESYWQEHLNALHLQTLALQQQETWLP